MNKYIKFSFLVFFTIFSSLIFNSCSTNNSKISSEDNTPKYIFLFIGDGMGSNHIALCEAYFKNITGEVGFENLTMTGFPVFGQCETYCKNRQITDSGAAGSAIACGEKANADVISYFEDPINKNVESIAKIAGKNGLKTGIITTVSLNHATPAAFYASNESRNNYYEIGLELPKSNFNFFGGGGFYHLNGKSGDKESLVKIAMDSGYHIYNKYEDLKNISKDNEKVIFINPVILDESEMPYAIDRKYYGGAGLSEIVSAGIKYLDNEKGFFMMVEGGKIDWCSHENDAATIIHEVKDFDNAIKEAYNFYLEHPDNTLIIVTADHETGGISLGTSANKYESNFSILDIQKCSQFHFGKKISEYKNSNQKYNKQEIIDMAEEHFYSYPDSYNEYEIDKVSEAFDYYFYDRNNLEKAESYDLYGGYNPVSISLTKILNRRSSVDFTSWSHTAARVPVYSIGNGSEKFSGNMNNTDIKFKIMDIMGW